MYGKDLTLKKLEEENVKLRVLMHEIHQSWAAMTNFNKNLRRQIRHNLYKDPPSGITYGEQTRTIGTQTDFVPKVNERADCEVEALLERDGC